MKPLETAVANEDLATLLHCSINYAFGRRTYITHTVAEMVRRYWHALDESSRQNLTSNLRSDIAAYTRSETLIGDKCDDTSWRSLLAWMELHP